jgi:LCP family protein required for cell wall assembly
VDLKDEVKDIINSRPTPEERKQYKADAKAKKSKHGIPEKRKAFPRKPGYIVALLILALVTAAFLGVLIIADMLPPDLTVILSVGVMALLLLTNFMFASRYRWKRITGILIALILVLVLSSVTGFMGSTYAMLNKISSAAATGADGPAARSVNVKEEPFNIYITGIDQWASEKGLDLERSDVNMIVTVNPVTKKVLLTSIPRDSYVKLHTAQQMDKLTHTGIYGVDETINSVQDWLNVDLNYYVKMNFTAVSDIINAMGGIRVYSPVAFESSLKGYKYEKGWNNMSGRQALYFARERHAFEGQDSMRVENQQRVVEAVIKKMTSSTTLLTKYGDIMTAAGDNLSTNMSTTDMTELVRMQITDLAEWDIQSQKIEGDYGEDYVASLTQAQKFSVYLTDPASVRKCVDAINALQNPSAGELEEAAKKTSKSFVVNAINVIVNKVTSPKGEE